MGRTIWRVADALARVGKAYYRLNRPKEAIPLGDAGVGIAERCMGRSIWSWCPG